ncbi:MAG TPA: phosphoglucosamine mutase, partial [Mycobacteriales bacterium]|nr:phosphoglucosamine mutase [Mycobacteriales bacterium]
MSRLFGTDGVRGVAGVDLTADLARDLVAAAVAELADPTDRPLVVVGRDTRPSGSWLTEAVVDGLTGAGADVALLGVIPTPAVARAVADGVPAISRTPAFGVVISASHNPPADNGVKFFGAGGRKLTDDAERRIEQRLGQADTPGGGGLVADLSDDPQWYVDAVLATVPNRLDGLRVVVDCANGAAATVAAAAYGGAGADVTVINDDLDGERINDGCGATHLDAVAAAVRSAGADVGVAHDGDADRCLAVTAAGEPVDGDALLAILALDLQRRGQLRNAAIAATVMSNLGLTKALEAHGVTLHTTPVGDRHVIERMQADDLALGGEQSGHIVLADHATTGDGILTGLHLLSCIVAAAQPLQALASLVSRYPQVLVNVRVDDRDAALAAVAPAAG